MGLFKKLGSSLKRVISIKNITRAATGQFGAIGKDVLRVVSTEDPKEVRKKQAEALAKGQTYTPAPVTPIEMPIVVESVLNSEGDKFSKKLVTEVAKNESVQNATSLLTKVGLEAFWNNNKKWIQWVIGFVFALIGFFTIRMLLKGSKRGKSRR